MPYIKISDPNIIDIAAWQQVINVINQHSDTLSAITNNFGLQGSGTTDWNGETEIYEEFNSGSQKILYGKVRIDTRTLVNDAANPNKDSSLNSDRMFYQEIVFDGGDTGTSSFSARPVITVTAALVGTTVITRNSGLVCTVIAVNDKDFTVRIVKTKEFSDDVAQTSTVSDPKPTSIFELNWIAIGPK